VHRHPPDLQQFDQRSQNVSSFVIHRLRSFRAYMGPGLETVKFQMVSLRQKCQLPVEHGLLHASCVKNSKTLKFTRHRNFESGYPYRLASFHVAVAAVVQSRNVERFFDYAMHRHARSFWAWRASCITLEQIHDSDQRSQVRNLGHGY
jgi:hypothetical protein